MGSLANSLGELRWCMWHTACFNMVLTSTASNLRTICGPARLCMSVWPLSLAVDRGRIACPCFGPSAVGGRGGSSNDHPAYRHLGKRVSVSPDSNRVLSWAFLGSTCGCCALRGASDSGGASLGLRRARLSGRSAASGWWVRSGAAPSGRRAWSVCTRAGSLCRTTTSLGGCFRGVEPGDQRSSGILPTLASGMCEVGW